MSLPVWRALTAADLADVGRIAAIVHAAYPERPEVMAERLRLFPAGCHLAVDPQGGDAFGYAVAHPALAGHPPALDSLLGEIAPASAMLHIHDIALLSAARRGGLGRAVVRGLLDSAAAAGLAHLSLVAVGDAAPYWERLGFADAPVADPAALASYGTKARYMTAPSAVVAARLGEG